MSIDLDLGGGGETIPLSDVEFIRQIGRPVRWVFHADIGGGGMTGGQLPALVSALESAPVRVRVSSSDHGSLGPEGTIVSARWQGRGSMGAGQDLGWFRDEVQDRLLLEAHVTKTQDTEDPFVPRRRVHVVRTMRELAAKFEHVAALFQGVENELDTVKFVDEDRASIVQDGISDWQFFSRILDQCHLLFEGKKPWTPLTLTGSVDENEGTQGRWLVLPSVKTAYDAWNNVSSRRYKIEGQGIYERTHFEPENLADRVAGFPSGVAPSVVRVFHNRNFSGWGDWRIRDVPLFADGSDAMAWKIVDRLQHVKQKGESIRWWTAVSSLPQDAALALPGVARRGRIRPWVGIGQVEETSTSGPWIKLKLPGFEDGEDILNVRLATPYSGKNGQRGLHFVPENGTQVIAAWSGRFDESVIVLGNTREREKKAEFESPSLWLESKLTSQLEEWEFRELGDVTVHSDLVLDVAKKTRFEGAKEMQVTADTTNVRLKGGLFKTGRGV